MSQHQPETLPALRATYEAAARNLGDECRWVAWSVPAQTGGAYRLLDLRATNETVFFTSGPGSSAPSELNLTPLGRFGAENALFVGVGSVTSRRFEGDSRFVDASAFIQSALCQVSIPKDLSDDVRFFGGASFSPGRDGKGRCWADFGDALFLLPRCTYVDAHDQARLIAICDRKDPEPTLKLACELLAHLATQDSVERGSRRISLSQSQVFAMSRSESEEPSTWRAMVDDIKRAIRSDDVQKVVAARRVTLQLSSAPRPSDVLERLNEQNPLCALFALRVGDKTFVGATPERLIQRRGMSVSTEALAGSSSGAHENAANWLLESAKNRAEHSLVVQAIETALRPLCAQLFIAKEPRVRRLRTILHLQSFISGELEEDTHVLTLVDRLHPTPAVGGLPRERAVAFISEHETAERGWYAAPLGWVNARGDGEFVVALRSGLLAGDKVHLYAGAGIVADSDWSEEYAETELKLSGMLGALGLDAPGSSFLASARKSGEKTDGPLRP